MSKLTKEERDTILEPNPETYCSYGEGILMEYPEHKYELDEEKVVAWVEQKKKQWQEEIKNKIEKRLDYCERENGIRECKNCGLSEDDFNF